MLNQSQIEAARTQLGITPPGAIPVPPNRLSTLQQAWGTSPTSETNPPSSNPIAETAGNYMSDMQAAASKIGSSVTEGASTMSKGGLVNVAKGALQGSLGTTAGAVQALFAPIAAPIQTLLTHVSAANTKNPGPTANIVNSPQAQQARQQIADWAQSHPDLSRTLADAFTVGTAGLGSGALDTSVGDIVTGAKNAVVKGATTAKNVAIAGKEAIVGTPAEQATAQTAKVAAQTAKQTQTSIDAVNPDLSGKKLVNAYKQTVTGQREVTPPSIFREEGLSPDQQAINLGTRLHDLGLGKDPAENLNKLGTALEDTETKLNAALEGDPEIVYNGDKPTLLSNLETAKTQMPREFSSIKDSKAAYNDVMKFAQEKIAQAPDTIKGLREARTEFDTQAQREYPNAYKDGSIDTKTPAGRAIKTARDMMNKHLYDTAPNGSEIQKLIGREADIFRATDNIAPKAAAGHGKNLLDQQVVKHPALARYIKYGIAGLGIDKAVETVTGHGL